MRGRLFGRKTFPIVLPHGRKNEPRADSTTLIPISRASSFHRANSSGVTHRSIGVYSELGWRYCPRVKTSNPIWAKSCKACLISFFFSPKPSIIPDLMGNPRCLAWVRTLRLLSYPAVFRIGFCKRFTVSKIWLKRVGCASKKM